MFLSKLPEQIYSPQGENYLNIYLFTLNLHNVYDL